MAEYIPIPRIARTIPFGYVVDKDDEWVLQPVVFELEALEKAREHVKQYSLREVADWLSEITGRKISYGGLRKRLDNDTFRRTSADSFKYWTKRAEEAAAKAKAIEEGRIGARQSYPSDGQLSFDFGD